jgi:hypothetical protein
LLSRHYIVALLLLLQAATSKQELLQLLSNMALGLMPETLRAADGPQPEAQDFLIRGMSIDKAGFMVVGDAVRVGQRVRFMVSCRFEHFFSRRLRECCIGWPPYDCFMGLAGAWGVSL